MKFTGLYANSVQDDSLSQLEDRLNLTGRHFGRGLAFKIFDIIMIVMHN